MSLLDELALKYGTDKGSQYHNYCNKYDKILFPLREKFTNILEIGVANGSSVRMWEEYFPNATIHGVDFTPECKNMKLEGLKLQ